MQSHWSSTERWNHFLQMEISEEVRIHFYPCFTPCDSESLQATNPVVNPEKTGPRAFFVVSPIDLTMKELLGKFQKKCHKNVSKLQGQEDLQIKTLSGWWFQPISKILVKLDHFPK